MVVESPRIIGGPIPPFLKSHPVVLLLLLTPGIPEYLSSSSAINAIVFNPFLFLFQIVANLGLYGTGALLIYEAKVRWKKGWATVLLLGAAYGILEEGVALSTLFNSNAGPVGALGVYGHWLGVNWVWSAGIVPFHALFSISLPIMLLGVALPETVGRSLLSKRRIIVTSAIFTLDVIVLTIVVFFTSSYWMGLPILILSLLLVGGLVWAARLVQADALAQRVERPSISNRKLAIVGASFFPVVLVTEGLGQGVGLPAGIDFIVVLVVQALYLAYLTRKNWHDRPRSLIALAIGLVIPIAVFGVVAELALPMTLLADAAIFIFFRRLWRLHQSNQGVSQTIQFTARPLP
jgi:hypothetical protein